MITACRPTLRCLESDLPNDWEEASDRVAASHGANAAVPLVDLRHPIIRKAAEDFPEDGGDADILRESISGLTNPVWWKVKIGSRWRGAVWEDPDTGQAWLVAAGYRRAGEGTDFYRQFMATVTAKGADHFKPDDADRKRLERELRATRLDRWAANIHRRAQDEIAAVWDGGVRTWEVMHPKHEEQVLAEVELTVESEEIDGDSVLEVTLSIACKDYAAFSLFQWVELVVLTAIDPREQQWRSLETSGVPTHSQVLMNEEIADLRSRSTADRVPAVVEPGSVAHYAHEERLAEQTIEGQGTMSLCGASFVPRQDHESLPKCQTCTAIYQAMDE